MYMYMYLHTHVCTNVFILHVCSSKQSVAKDHAPTLGEFFRLLARSVMWSVSIYDLPHYYDTCGQVYKCNAQVHVQRYWVVCVEVMLSPPHRLLNHAHLANVQIAGLDKLLEEELKWLLKVRVCTLKELVRVK